MMVVVRRVSVTAVKWTAKNAIVSRADREADERGARGLTEQLPVLVGRALLMQHAELVPQVCAAEA